MGCFGCRKKNLAPAPKKCKPKRKAWTQAEWQRHGRYLTKLAVPKKDFQLELLGQIRRERKVPLCALCPRIVRLACPKPTFCPRITYRRCPLGPRRYYY